MSDRLKQGSDTCEAEERTGAHCSAGFRVEVSQRFRNCWKPWCGALALHRRLPRNIQQRGALRRQTKSCVPMHTRRIPVRGTRACLGGKSPEGDLRSSVTYDDAQSLGSGLISSNDNDSETSFFRWTWERNSRSKQEAPH